MPGRARRPSMMTDRTNSIRLLVTIPHEPFRDQVCVFLADRGYQVLQAGNTDEALTACASADVLIADVPGRSAQELARTARLFQPALKILVICGEPAECEHSVPKLDWIEKPFSWRELLKKIRELGAV